MKNIWQKQIVSHLGCTGMHYMTNRSRWMQKNMFGMTCPEALFVTPVPVPPKPEKIVCRRFAPRTLWNALCDPQIPSDAKTKVQPIMSQHNFYKIRTGPTRAWKILCRCFAPRTYQNAPRDMQIPTDAKTKDRCNVSNTFFVESVLVPTELEKYCVDDSLLGWKIKSSA
jgi:hypothetical protein